jgi:PAS domain S-box-containing protein
MLRSEEQRFHVLIDAVRDYAIYMLDPEGKVISLEQRSRTLHGCAESEIIGQTFSVFFSPEDRAAGKPQLELQIAGWKDKFEGEGWRVRNDGTPFWASVVITAIRDRYGELAGFAKVTRDDTQRMRAEAEMEKEVSERRKTEHVLLRAQNALRELSVYLMKSQDDERRRIGRELHDSLGQGLVALKMKPYCAAPSRRA